MSADLHAEKLLILDFGSQYAQLIARRVREQNVYCQILRHDIAAERLAELAPKGITVQTVNPGPIDTDMARDIDMDKTSPEETAANIIAGIEAGNADIFPDGASTGMFNAWSDVLGETLTSEQTIINFPELIPL